MQIVVLIIQAIGLKEMRYYYFYEILLKDLPFFATWLIMIRKKVNSTPIIIVPYLFT